MAAQFLAPGTSTRADAHLALCASLILQGVSQRPLVLRERSLTSPSILPRCIWWSRSGIAQSSAIGATKKASQVPESLETPYFAPKADSTRAFARFLHGVWLVVKVFDQRPEQQVEQIINLSQRLRWPES